MKNRRSTRHDVAHLCAYWTIFCSVCVAGTILLGAKPARAQSNLGNAGIAARFPQPSQVVAAYPDEASRFVALKVLNSVLDRNTTGRSPGAYDKGSSYVRAMQQISVKYNIDEPNSKAARDFGDHVRKLLADETFRRSVLERYQLTDLPAETRPTGQLGNSKPPSAGIRLDSGQLPESLREFKLFGQEYQAGLQSGKVVDEKTWSETHFSTVTAPATFQVVGDQVYQSGGGTTTSSSTVTKDRIWVRTANGGEAAWTFSGGNFVARQGQVLSAIAQPFPNGSSQFLAAYNHSTGQFEAYRPGSSGQKKIGTMLPWLITTLVGAAGFIFGTAILFMPTANLLGMFSPAGLMTILVIVVRGGVVCLIGAAITARILIGFVRGKIEGERGSRFEKEFKPAYLRFLQESTPVIVQSLASV